MTTEVKKPRPINRLQSMYALRALVDEKYQASQEAEKEGKPVAWCMVDPFHSPFFNAMGVQSVYPEQAGGGSAAGGAAQEFLDRSEAEGFPNNLCGYMQNALGYAARMMDLGGDIPPEASVQGAMPKPMLLIARNAWACDSGYKTFQALGRYFDAPVWMMESATSYYGRKEDLFDGVFDNNINYIVAQLKDFADFLERLLGKKMDWDKFEFGIDSIMEMDAVWYEVIDILRRARPCPMHARDVYSSMSASMLSTSDPKAVTDLYKNMRDEVQYRVDNKIAGINAEERYRLPILGLPPWHNMGFFDQLAERGWNFVYEYGYHPPRPIDLSWVKDPVEKLVRYRVQSLERAIDAEFKPEEAAKVKEEIAQNGVSNKLAAVVAKNHQIDGGWNHKLLTCRVNAIGAQRIGQQYMDAWKVPTVEIEGDIVDTRLFDPADAMRKCEAFEETMDHYKQVRKEDGLEW
ncbi:2-hydroxyacyl-CoA dehydratase [Chloroflexota bacterium]